VRSQRFSRWRRAALRADRAGGILVDRFSSDSFGFERGTYIDKKS